MVNPVDANNAPVWTTVNQVTSGSHYRCNDVPGLSADAGNSKAGIGVKGILLHSNCW
jgi:hypothetical protein